MRAVDIIRKKRDGHALTPAEVAAMVEGIARMSREMPDVPIYVGAVDECLNDVGFIYPGLGDAGDRQFGTGPGPGGAVDEAAAETVDSPAKRIRS